MVLVVRVRVRGERGERSKDRDEGAKGYNRDESEEYEGSRGSCTSLPRHC